MDLQTRMYSNIKTRSSHSGLLKVTSLVIPENTTKKHLPHRKDNFTDLYATSCMNERIKLLKLL